jgi:hypothetical protein
MNKISDTENEICSVETLSRHPALYHYTSTGAFENIIGSQTLWCSHYQDMLDRDNADYNEVLLMRRLLPQAVTPLIKAIVIEKHFNRNERRKNKSWQIAPDLVNALYRATIDGEGEYATIQPYSVSFSTHADDSDFDREHAIRSQWDAYGSQGYCLVFDTRDVSEMLKREGTKKYWAWLVLRPVRYNDRPIQELFPELVHGLADVFRRRLDRATASEVYNRKLLHDVEIPEDATKEFLNDLALLKAVKYKFEREVRIVAMPGTIEAAKYAAREYPTQFDANALPPEIRKRPKTNKRYIALFESLGLRLPVKCVIVGPGDGQEERAQRARAILPGVPVTISLCP